MKNKESTELSKHKQMENTVIVTDETIINKIYHIRDKKVMLDRDLAAMYGVETRTLNQTVKRNEKRFPTDFMFQLTGKELKDWKSQFVTSNKEVMGLRKLPNAFTEQGVAMLSSVLNSETAIEVNIHIIRIFTKMREAFLTNKELLLKMEQLEKKIIEQGQLSDKHENDIQLIFNALKKLLNPRHEPRNPIGFKIN
jgi:hypothetical protein